MEQLKHLHYPALFRASKKQSQDHPFLLVYVQAFLESQAWGTYHELRGLCSLWGTVPVHPIPLSREEQFHKDLQELRRRHMEPPLNSPVQRARKSYLTNQEVLESLCYLSLWSPVNEMNIRLVFAPSYNEG